MSTFQEPISVNSEGWMIFEKSLKNDYVKMSCSPVALGRTRLTLVSLPLTEGRQITSQ